MSLLLSLLVLNAPINTAFAEDEPEEEEAAEEEAPPQTTFSYALSGTLWVQTTKTGVGAAIAHDHSVHSSGWTGTATWDTADASKCNVSISLPMSTLVDEPSIRSNIGLPEGPDAGDRETITGHMLADNQLNGGKYTTISYQSTSCSGTSGAVTVQGNLTIVGKAAPVSASLNITADEGSFAATGSFSANHSAWGIEPYSALFGAIGNAEQLKFGMNVTGAPN